MSAGVALGQNSIFAGTGRVQALARWLADIPEGASALITAVRDRESGGVEVIARWPAPADGEPDGWSAIVSTWASRIEALLQDYASEVRGVVQASVRWVDEAGNVLSQKRLNVRSDAEPDPFHSFEANPQASLGQQMSHNQVLIERLDSIVQHTVIESSRRAEDSYRRVAELQLKNEQLQKELEELRADRVEEVAAQTVQDAIERDPVNAKMEKVLEIFLMQWMAKQGQSKLPPSNSGPSDNT